MTGKLTIDVAWVTGVIAFWLVGAAAFLALLWLVGFVVDRRERSTGLSDSDVAANSAPLSSAFGNRVTR